MNDTDRISRQLARLLSADPQIEAFLEGFFENVEDYEEDDVIDINDVDDYSELDRHEAIEIFKKIDGHNLGTYKVGRRSKPTRVVIDFDGDDFQNALEIKKDGFRDSFGKLTSAESVQHGFLLRPDFKVTVELPSDFSRLDCERMKNWLDTIPF